jgi:hypothetical protein
MPVEKLQPNSFRSCKTSLGRIPKESSALNDFWSRARRPFLAKFGGISFPAQLVFTPIVENAHGTHQSRLYIQTLIMRVRLFCFLYNICSHITHSAEFSPYDIDLLAPRPQTVSDVIPMTRLQIMMSREVGGWPMYAIVIAMGQVCA